MTANLAQQPWYRHRWPWILMAGPAVVILAGIVTVWLAIRSSDGLVADDYYKQGLGINRTLARAERAQAMGLKARLVVREDRVEIRLAGGSGAQLPARIRLTFSHATRGGLDQTLFLAGQGGIYVGAVAALSAGRWQVLVEDEAANWRLAGTASLPQNGEIALGAANK